MPTPRRRAHAHARRRRIPAPPAQRASRTAASPATLPEPPFAEAFEKQICEWLAVAGRRLPATVRTRGRPPVLPAMLLWTAMLVAIVRGLGSCRDLWRLISQQGLWHHPRIEVSDMAIYHRLERTSAESLRAFFELVSALLAEHFRDRSAVPLAKRFAGLFAIDVTVLDPLLRHLKVLRGVPPGAHELLGGALACLFDLRRQQWRKVLYRQNPMENEKPSAPELVAELPAGSLVLADLGYFAFAWFDYLQERGLHFVSRLREGTTFTVLHELYRGGNARVQLSERLIYLGTAVDSRAAYPVRLMEVKRQDASGTVSLRRYITDLLDPQLLPAWEVVGLYAYRWDIESAFKLLKGKLGLHLLWSAHRNALLQQLYATLILCQMLLTFRFEIAQQAKADLREVSVELMLRWLPQLAASGEDPVARFVAMGRAAGFIRPFRGVRYEVPQVPDDAYQRPPELPPPRAPRYRNKDKNPLVTQLEATLRTRFAPHS